MLTDTIREYSFSDSKRYLAAHSLTKVETIWLASVVSGSSEDGEHIVRV